MKKRLLRILPGLLLIATMLSVQASAAPVSRAEMISSIVSALDLPLWSGSRHFQDLPASHPHSRAVESAAALGVLHPAEKFYPDMEASRAEALMYSLRAMGLAKEAAIIGRLQLERHTDLPAYIHSYYRIAETMSPQPPEALLSRPRDVLQTDDMPGLARWLAGCRGHLFWEERFEGNRTTLILNRSNIGRPPASWAVQAGVFPTGSREADSLMQKIRARGIPCSIEERPSGRTVLVGPFLHYAEAWAKSDTVKDLGETRIVPFEEGRSEALFWSAIVTNIDRSLPRIVTAGEIAGRRQPLSWIAQNTDAEGAVNGGFFDGVNIVGSLVTRGFPVNGPWRTRSAIGWNRAGTFHFGPGQFRTVLRSKDTVLEVNEYNRAPGNNGVSVYSPHIWYFAMGIPADATEGKVVDGTLTEVKGAHLSSHFVPRDGYLVVARGHAAHRLKQIPEGSSLEMELSWHDSGFEDCTEVLQAGPMLLFEGNRALSPEGFTESFITGRHPRSIVGMEGNNLWWIVIDGRDSWHSRGCSLEEALSLAKGLGLSNALNLDGGGSSTMWWRGAVVNSPSGASERPLPYAVVF